MSAHLSEVFIRDLACSGALNETSNIEDGESLWQYIRTSPRRLEMGKLERQFSSSSIRLDSMDHRMAFVFVL